MWLHVNWQHENNLRKGRELFAFQLMVSYPKYAVVHLLINECMPSTPFAPVRPHHVRACAHLVILQFSDHVFLFGGDCAAAVISSREVSVSDVRNGRKL